MRVALLTIFVCAMAASVSAQEAPKRPHKFHRRVVVYHLKHVAATAATEMIKREFSDARMAKKNRDGTVVGPPVIVVPDAASNTLLVSTVPELADKLGFAILIFDMAEYHKRHPCPRGVCCFIDKEAFTESLELSKTISHWLLRKPSSDLTSEDLRITEAMSKTVSITLHDKTLKQAMRHIALMADFNCVLDMDGLKDVGATPDSVVNVKMRKVKLHSAFDQLLRPLKLTYIIEDEVLKVTSARRLGNAPITRFYPVPDLVASVKDGEAIIDFDTIAQRIETTILPESWKANGGAASIQKCESKLSLVVRQSRSGHDAIAMLLKKIRRERAAEYQIDELVGQ